jgi:hypothetical protein
MEIGRNPETDSEADLRILKARIQLRTRVECERACERIVNWLKDKRVDANLGNAMLNGVRTVLSSKTATEELELKVADRELLRRIQEMEERVCSVEEAAGIS